MASQNNAREPSTVRAGLTRERVLLEALNLVDRDGPAALTMRRLGAALGVEAMSLYHHVEGREGLLDGVAEVLITRLPVAKPEKPWEEAVRAFGTGIRRIALAHPAAFQLVGMRPLRSTAMLRPVGTLLVRLRQAGLTPADSVATYRLVASFARGFALAEIAGFTLSDGQPAALPASLVEFSKPLTANHASAFRQGLELIVDGISARLSLRGQR